MNVSISSPSNNQCLVYNSTTSKWTNGNSSSSTLASDSDVYITSPTQAQFLQYSSALSKWVNATYNEALNITTVTYVVQSDYSNGSGSYLYTPSNNLNYSDAINIYICDLNLSHSANYFNLPSNLSNGQSIIVQLTGTASSNYITFQDTSHNAIFTSSGNGAIFQTKNSSAIYQFTYYSVNNNPWYVSGFNLNSWNMTSLIGLSIPIDCNYVAIYSKPTSSLLQTTITLPYSYMSSGQKITVKDIGNNLSNSGCNLYIINASSGTFGLTSTAGVTLNFIYINGSLVSV
jgi:hypothetical protein